MPQVDCAERSRKRGVDIPGNDDPVRPFLAENRLEALDDARRLLSVRARADAQHVIRLGHAELGEEDIRHRFVVVLARVDDDVPVLPEPLAAGRDDRRHLHEVRPRADDVDETGQLARCLFRKSIWSAAARSRWSPR